MLYLDDVDYIIGQTAASNLQVACEWWIAGSSQRDIQPMFLTMQLATSILWVVSCELAVCTAGS